MRFIYAPVLLTLLLVACSADLASPADAGPGGGDADLADASRDAGPPSDGGPGCVTALPVDVLWVIDNSNSMREEQSNLTINFNTLVETLTDPPDSDGDGEPDYPAVEDLRVGVVTTDMGVGANMVVGCDAGGDDGVLVSSARGPDPACAGVTVGPPPWLEFRPADDPAAFSDSFSCIARVGTDGCGLEQQLEAGLLAVTDRAVAGQPNEGFVRDDSLLAVVFVTDEDDCSANDGTIFDASGEAEMRLGPYSTRCADHPELLHPVSRYIDGLSALRTGDRARNLVVAGITGVPRDLVDAPSLIDYDALLADPRMQYTRDPMDDMRLVPACDAPGIGSAVPGRRIVELIKPFAERGDGVVQSICSESFARAVEAIARVIGGRLCGPLI